MAPESAAVPEEISKPYLISNFNSQTSESSNLLSLPSEAPDIRNWFSTYVYESPATLDLECGFNGFIKSKGPFKNIKSEEGIDGEKNKILEIPENPKDPSDDNDGDCVGRPCDESNNVCEKAHEDSEDEYQEIVDSSNLLSLPSEPPDIRNWFSSYEYESPATVTSEEGNDHGKENILERIADSKDRNDDGDDVCVKRPYDQFAKGTGFLEDSDQECHLKKQGCHSVSTELPPSLKSFNEHFRGQVLYKCHYISSPDKENLTVEDDQISRENLNDKGFSKEGPVSLEADENSFKGQDKSKEKSAPIIHLKGKDLRRYTRPKSNISIERSDGNSPASNGKEQKDLSNNGFISTRRNRTVQSNTGKSSTHSMAIGEVSSSENAGLSLVENKKKSFSDGRMAFSDRTNVCMESNPEISGKWQCPRKRKPFVGLPMKQLGLERWVFRVQ